MNLKQEQLTAILKNAMQQNRQQTPAQPAVPAQQTGASGSGGSVSRAAGKQQGISWGDYQKYENDYATWKQTGQHTDDYNTWANEQTLNQWKAIRDRARNGAQAALIGDRYYTLDRDRYNQYEKDYRYWQKTGKHTKGYETWADEDGLETWKTIRDYNIGVKNGTNPSMELQGWINGLDPDVLAAVKKKYQEDWVYDVTDPEDMERQAQGLMPKNRDKYYSGKSEMDRWLYSMGLPSNKSSYLSKQYNAAAEEIAKQRELWGEQMAYDFDSTPENEEAGRQLASYWQSTWKYGTGADDQQRKAQGLPPASIDKLYTDSPLDQYYKERGLPPAAMIGKYAEAYDSESRAYNDLVNEYARRRSASPWMSGQEVLEQIMREDTEGKYRTAIANMEGTAEQKDVGSMTGKDLLTAYLGTGSSSSTKSGTRSPFAFTADELDKLYQDSRAEWWKEQTGQEYHPGDSLYDYVTGSDGDTISDKSFNFRKDASKLTYDQLQTRIGMIDQVLAELSPMMKYGDWAEANREKMQGKSESVMRAAYGGYVRTWKREHPKENEEKTEKLRENLQEQRRYLSGFVKDAAGTKQEELSQAEQERRQPVYDTLAGILGWDKETASKILAGKGLGRKELAKIAGEGSTYRTVYDKLHAEKDALANDPQRKQAEKDRQAAIQARTAELVTGIYNELIAGGMTKSKAMSEARKRAAEQAEKENPETGSDYELAKIGADAWSVIMNPTEYEQNAGSDKNDGEYMSLLPYIKPEQLTEFARIAQEEGAAAAGRYWTEIRPEAEKLQRAANTEAAQVYGEASPIGATLTSALLTIPAGAMGIRQEIAALNGDYRENDWRGNIGRVQETMRQSVQQHIRDNNKGLLSMVLPFAYGTGMSMVDSLQTMALGNAGLLLTGFRAAGSTVDEYIDKGMSAEQAGLMGLISGSVEYLTEKMQMDRLVDMLTKGSAKGIIKGALLGEGLSEGGEEVVSEVMDIIADTLMTGDQSEFLRQIERNKRNGMSDGDALWSTIWSNVWDKVFPAFAGGYISGALFGLAGGTIGAGNVAKESGYKWHQFRKGQQIIEAYNDAVKKGGTVLPEGRIRGLYKDLNDSGLSDESRLGAAMILQNAARMPRLFMSENGMRAIEDLQTAIRKAAESNGVRKAEANEATIKAQNRLNGLLSGIRSAYDQAGQALASGNMEAQARFLNQMYDTIDAYQRAFSEARASLETRNAREASAAAESERSVNAAVQRARVTFEAAGAEMGKNLLQGVLVDNNGNPLPITDATIAAIRSGQIDVFDAIRQDRGARQRAYEKAGTEGNEAGQIAALQAMHDAGSPAEYDRLEAQLNEQLEQARADGNLDEETNLLQALHDLDQARRQEQENTEAKEAKPAEKQAEPAAATEQAAETERAEAPERTETKAPEETRAEKTTKYRRGVNTENVDLSKQPRRIRRQARVLDALGQRSGTVFVLHDSMDPYMGRNVNGKIDADGVMHINMGQIGDGLLYYATHELTHAIRRVSEANYVMMRDSIKDHLRIDSLTWDGMIDETMAIYGWDDTERNRDMAEEELICDRMPAAFADSAFVSDLINRDAGFVRRILNRLNGIYQDIAESIRAGAEKEGESTSEDIRSLMQARDTVREMADALQDGLTMLSIKDGHTEAARYVEDGKDGTIRFNLETMDRDLAGFLHDIAQAEVPGFGPDELKDLEKGVKHIMDIVRKHTDLFDYDAPTGKNRPWTPLKENSDKHYRMALDFSTLCKKRILTQAIVERLQQDLKRSLMPGEQAAIRMRLQDMQKQLTHIQVACGLCYVEAARLKSPKVINAFIADIPKSVAEFYAKGNQAAKDEIALRHAALLESYAKDGKIPKSKKELPKAGQDEWNRINHEVWDRTEAPEDVMERARQLKPEQFLSAKSLADLAVTDPKIYQAFKLKVTSAARSKTLETDMPFERGDSFAAGNALIAAMNQESGFRHQSWSDFQFLHVLDTMAAIMEMSTRGAKMHAYSKVAEMAHVVGKTGLMLNLSMIPAGESGLDGDGKLVWDPVEGMAWDVMMQLRDEYPDTVGNIAIGITDAQIRALMASDDVDYIIPYHASGLNKAMRKLMGLHGWISYQSSQNEKKFMETDRDPPALADWFKEDAAKQATDGRAFMVEASRKYLEECFVRGYVPKFSQYLVKNGNRYSLPEDGSADGYWKMLIDRKMVNQQTGKVIIQQAVRPVFDTERIGQLMEADVDNPAHEQNRIAEDTVVEEIMRGEMPISDEETRKVAQKEAAQLLAQYRTQQRGVDLTDVVTGERHSLARERTTQEQDAEYMDAVNNGDMETAQRMVDEAAEKAFSKSRIRGEDGKLLPVYHGTSEQFRAFDMSKGRANMDIRGAFFSPWEIDAEGYGENVGRYYLDIKNPAPEGIGYRALNRFKGQNNAGIKAREYLISLGYDGVNNGNEEYIAFYPEQIKSADPVTYHPDGTPVNLSERFNRESPDISYSLARGREGQLPATPPNANWSQEAWDIARDAIERFNLDMEDRFFERGIRTVKEAEKFRDFYDPDKIDEAAEAMQPASKQRQPAAKRLQPATERQQPSDALEAAVPVYDITPNGRNSKDSDLTEAALGTQERNAEDGTRRMEAVNAITPESELTESQKRAIELQEKKKREREKRKERQKRKAEAERRAAEERAILTGAFAPRSGQEDMEARTRRNRLTEQAEGTTRELNDLVTALTQQLQPTDRKTPNPKRVQRAVNALLGTYEADLAGVGMSRDEIAERLGGIIEAYRNNPDTDQALDDLLTGSRILAEDMLASRRITPEGMEDGGEYDELLDTLSDTVLRVGPKGKEQLRRAYGSLKEFRKAVGNSLRIKWVDSDTQSNFEDLDGQIGGYTEGDLQAQIEKAFGNVNTLDIVDIAEFVQEQRERGPETVAYKDAVRDDEYRDHVADLALRISEIAYDQDGEIPNLSSYGDRGARAIGDVRRDMERIAGLVADQEERIRAIREAGNEEAKAANEALARANAAYRRVYGETKSERDALAERNRILNEENERLVRSGAVSETTRAEQLRERNRLRRKAADAESENRPIRRENERLREQLERKEERFQRYVEKAHERETQRVEEAKTKAEERKNVEKLRKYVTKNATELNKWLQNPTKQKHVPVPLQEAVAGILENIDLAIGKDGGNARARDFAASVAGLKEFYSDYLTKTTKKYGEFMADLTASVPAGILDALDTISESVAKDRKTLGQMNSDELAKLNMILGQTRALVMDTNQTFRNKRFHSVDELGRQTQKDAAERGQRGIWKGGLKALQDLTSTKLMDAFSFFRTLGRGGESIADELGKGFERSYLLISDGQKFIADTLQKNGVTAEDTAKWSRDVIDVKLANTGTVKMTVGQAMNLYNLGKRAQALPHLLEGGLKIDDVGQGRQIDIFNVTADDLRRIGDQLTPQQKAVADAMQSYLANECADWGNEAWMEMYHYEMFGEQNYWPIKSAKESVRTRDAVETSQAVNAYVNMGSTKALVEHAKNPLLIQDAMDVYTAHVSQMARLNGLGPALEDALKWYNWVQKDAESNEKDWKQTTKGAIDKLIGPDGSRYFLKLVQDINGLSGGESGTGLASQLMSRYKRAAVAGKLRVVIQQPMAVLRAMALVPAKYFSNDYAGNIKANIREMQEHNGLAWWKSQGNYDIGTGRSMRGILFGTSDGVIDKITNAAMEPAGWADDFAWGWLWSAVKKETADLHPELRQGSDEYWNAVNERFSDVVNQTQVVDGVLQRSDIMRSRNGLDQMATAFMAEPIKSWNMIANRVRALTYEAQKAGGWKAVLATDAGKKAGKELIRALIALAMSIAANSAILALHDTAKNRQRGDKFSKAFSENFFRNAKDDLMPWEYVPYIKDIAAIMQGESVDRMDMSMISDIYKAAQNGYKYFSGEGTRTGYKVAADILSVAGAAAGVPTTGLIATMETVVNGIHPGAIKKTKYLDKDDRDVLRAAGLSYDEGYGVVSQYKRHPFSEGSATSNADKGIRLLQAADAAGGKYDDEDYGALAAVLGIKYDPAKDGSLTEWTAEQAGKYMSDKQRELAQGKITLEKYDSLEEKYSGYADLLTELGY